MDSVADDMLRPSGTKEWFRVGASPDFSPYLPKPTPFQANIFPASLHRQMRVIHEGIDTAAARALPHVKVQLPSGPNLGTEGHPPEK